MTVAKLDDLRARNAGFRVRGIDELHHDLVAGCRSLGHLADCANLDVAGIERTIDGLRRVLVDLRIARGGGNAAA